MIRSCLLYSLGCVFTSNMNLIDSHGIRGLMTERSGKKNGLREYDPIRLFKYQNVWHQKLIPPATLKSTRAASCAETVLGYRVVVLHPDGELLGELSIRNQRLEEPRIKGQHSRRLMQSRAVILTLSHTPHMSHKLRKLVWINSFCPWQSLANTAFVDSCLICSDN